MKSILAFVFVIASTTSFAMSALPDGKWTGQGTYTTATGVTANYTENTTIQNNVLTAEIEAAGQKTAYAMTHAFDANGFTTVKIEDRTKKTTSPATGYCASMWCHVQAADGSFEMTYVFAKDSVYTLGSMVEQGTKAYFESSLKKAFSK